MAVIISLSMVVDVGKMVTMVMQIAVPATLQESNPGFQQVDERFNMCSNIVVTH